jgi:hypothetical protein
LKEILIHSLLALRYGKNQIFPKPIAVVAAKIKPHLDEKESFPLIPILAYRLFFVISFRYFYDSCICFEIACCFKD